MQGPTVADTLQHGEELFLSKVEQVSFVPLNEAQDEFLATHPTPLNTHPSKKF